MKQIYKNPSVEVITLKTQQFMMISLQEETTTETSGNLSREFDYEDEEEEYEDY